MCLPILFYINYTFLCQESKSYYKKHENLSEWDDSEDWYKDNE